VLPSGVRSGLVRWGMVSAAPPAPPPPSAVPSQQERAHHPSVLADARRRSSSLQLRLADTITRFAGSMGFIYLHAAVFATWMLVVERSPWPTLTLVVSLEAIFLSAFVLIGQNRQADFQRHQADHDFLANEQELKVNTELTRTIAELTRQIHAQLFLPPAAAAPPGPPAR